MIIPLLPFLPPPLQHGLATTYNGRAQCRCEECKRAWGRFQKARREGKASKGICIDCVAPSPNGLRCLPCRTKHNARERRRNAKRLSHKVTQQRLYEARLAQLGGRGENK